MENKTDFLKEGRIGNLKNDSLSFIQARQNALHQTATAYDGIPAKLCHIHVIKRKSLRVSQISEASWWERKTRFEPATLSLEG